MKYTKINLNDLLFSLAYYPWIIAWLFSSSLLKDYIHPYAIINYWQYIGIFFLIVKLLLKEKVKSLSFFVTLFLVLLAFIISYDNGNASFVFYSILLIFSGTDLSIEKIIRRTMILQIICLLVTVFAAMVGIVDNESVLSTAGGIVRNRHNLGYTYTTFVPNYFLSIFLEYIYLKKLFLSYGELLIVALFNIIIYELTLTRTTMFLVFLILLYLWLKRYFDYQKFFYKIAPVSFILLSCFSYLISIFYTPENKILSTVNSLLSSRIKLSQLGLQTWGIKLFGTSVKWSEDAISYNYIDSSYINILVCYGVIIFVIVVLGFTLANLKAIKIQNISLIFVLFVWAIRALIDPQLFLLWFNPFMFFVGKALLNQNSEEFI